MSDISPRPWRIEQTYFVFDNNDNCICNSESEGFSYVEDAEYAVKVINQYDSLIAERYAALNEVKRLKEMLIECQPTEGAGELCIFCRNRIWRSGHKDNCEYLQVIKEDEAKYE